MNMQDMLSYLRGVADGDEAFLRGARVTLDMLATAQCERVEIMMTALALIPNKLSKPKPLRTREERHFGHTDNDYLADREYLIDTGETDERGCRA